MDTKALYTKRSCTRHHLDVDTLLIGRAEETRRELILEPRASDTVTFAVTRDEAGTYSMEIDGLAGEFTVKAHPYRWALVSSIIVGVLGLLTVAAITVYFIVFAEKGQQLNGNGHSKSYLR